MNRLERFAKLKHFPVDFLTPLGVEDGPSGIIFANGNARARIRVKAESAHPTLWVKDDPRPMRVFGYDRVDDMVKQRRTLLVCEGESDALTAWLYNLPAIGIPGSTLTNLIEIRDVRPFERIVVIREPDDAGRKFAINVPNRLREIGYAGTVLVVDLGVKDLSELHLAKGAEEFERELDAAIEGAEAFRQDNALNALFAQPVTHNEAVKEPVWDDPVPVPELNADARYGLAGEILAAIEEQTEAHPAAILFTLLAGVGNAAGPGIYASVGSEHHPARLSVLVVAGTGTGKGQSLAIVRPILAGANMDWWDRAYCSGFNSGEGLIARLSGKHDEDGVAPERRAFIVEPEFSRVLTVNGRESSTLSAIARQAWDSGRLQVTTRRESLHVDGAHVSMVGHITPAELRDKLIGSDLSNGFANRLLFVHAHRVRKLPSGGHVDAGTYARLARLVSEALQVGPRELRFTAEAQAVWDALYCAEPEPGGLLGAVTGRSAPQRLRLAVGYAIFDGAREIRAEHVCAAEACWRYAYGSARHVFGSALADRVETRILDELRAAYPEGRDANELRDVFHRHESSARMNEACAALEARGLIRTEKIQTAGRARIMRYACALSALSALSVKRSAPTPLNALFAHNAQPQAVDEVIL